MSDQGNNEQVDLQQVWFGMPAFLVANLWRCTTKEELAVIIYICRHTFVFGEGFGKPVALTLDEFVHGRKAPNGKRIDYGLQMPLEYVMSGISQARSEGLITYEEIGGSLISNTPLLFQLSEEFTASSIQG